MTYKRQIRLFMLTLIITAMACTASFAEEQQVPLTPQNGVPLVIIYVNETQSDIDAAQAADPDHEYGNIAQMNDSERHTVRAIGEAEIIVPEGYKGEYGEAGAPAGKISLKYIRGRGNSTWTMDKRPYKIELNEKQDFFGMGENTDWALMANCFDSTLLRNRITAWIGTQLRLKYTPQMIPVDLVMVGMQKDANGNMQETSREYLGSYCLSETVDIGADRVGIDKLKKNDTDPDVITGGYLLAIYNQPQDRYKVPELSHFETPSGLAFTNDNPEFTEDSMTEGRIAQRDYIKGYMDKLDSLIMEPEKITPETHDQIAEMMELDSLADYWWIQEFSFNTDAFASGSTYLFKPRNDKLFWGPIWDFDLAWEVGIDSEQGFKDGFNNTRLTWVDALREKDPQFTQLLKDRWSNENDGIRKALLQVTADTDEGIMNRYAAEIGATFAADLKRWPGDYEERQDLDTSKEQVRTWINKRIDWVDNNLDQIDIVHCTITYETDQGDVFITKTARINDLLRDEPDAPEKPGYIFLGWKEKEKGSDHKNYRATGDTTFIPDYVDEKTAAEPAAIFLRCYENWTTYSEINEDKNAYGFDDPIILPEDAVIGKVKWSSSDENLLSFDEPGVGTVKGTGDVDITITLRNGLSTKMRLHIRSEEDGEELVFPTGMTFNQSSYTIGTGEVIQILPKLQPQGTPLDIPFYIYESSDESVAEIVKSESGLIIGKKPGKATITVTASDELDKETLEASFEITVTDKPEEKVSQNNASVQILPKGTKIKKLKKGSGSITVKWEKQSAKISSSRITGYQVQIAENKKFTKGKKTFTIKGYKKTSRKISDLKKNKKYYVRIRTYKTIGGTRLRSPWSKTRSIRTGK